MGQQVCPLLHAPPSGQITYLGSSAGDGSLRGAAGAAAGGAAGFCGNNVNLMKTLTL